MFRRDCSYRGDLLALLLWGTELAPSHSRQICPAIHHCHNRIEQFRHRLWREESLCFRVPRSQSSRSTQPEGQRQHSLGSTRPRCQSLRVREEGRAAKSKARAGKASGGSAGGSRDRKSTRLNSSHPSISYAVFCLKKK